jgi:N-acetylglucosaminyl-diphospho-decaprenol L-rhamnosyltransferase
MELRHRDITEQRDLADMTLGKTTVPVLSIVIVSWNDWDKLQRCLTSIYSDHLPAFEVIIIDNASADGTPEYVRAQFPDVELHCNSENVGHSKALNFGFQRARGELILLLDQDTELLPNSIGRMLGFLNSHPEADLVAPRTYNTDGTVQESARNFPTPMNGIFGRQSLLTRWFPANPISRRYLARQNLNASEPFEVEQVGGACMFFRRDLLATVGLWDESYFAYWNDTEWCYRVRAAGNRIFCVPAAEIYHHETSARRKGKRPIRIWLFHYNAYRLYTRWQTLGYGDPRSILAGFVLVARAGLLIAYNSILPRTAEPDTAPLAASGAPGEVPEIGGSGR